MADAVLSLAARGHSVERIRLALHDRDDKILDCVAENRIAGVLDDQGWGPECTAPRSPQQVLGRIGRALESGQILRPLLEAEAAAERWRDDELLGRCRRGVRRCAAGGGRRR